MTAGFETRQLDPEADERDLIELFETVFGYTVVPEMWAWKYRPSWTDDHYCWVARQDGKVIGYVGAVMVRGVVDGRPVPFFQLADVMVHPDYRKQHDFFGLGSKFIFEEIVERHTERVIYGFSNHRAFLWFKRIGLSDLVEKARVCTTHPETAPAGGSGAGFEFAPWTWADPGIDAAWRALGGTVGSGLVRDAAYLAWRYGGHPLHRYRLLGVSQGGQPMGWVVLGQAGKAAEVPVVDMLLAPQHTPAALQALAVHLDRPARFWLSSRRTPPFADEKESKTNVYLFVKESTLDCAVARETLHYTMGDADWW